MPELFAHYSDFHGAWPWKNFTPAEVACNHCGEFYHDAEALDTLQFLREGWGRPITVTSAHRCAAHNAAVGGTPNSQHLKIAFDCAVPRKDQDAFVTAALIAGFTGIGRYAARNFVHLDLGPRRAWNG